MGIFGIAKRGFGRALTHGKNWSKARRISKGERGKTITGVKPALKVPGASAKDIERSRQWGHTQTWSKRQAIAKDLDDKIKAGKAAIKKRAHLGQTKVLKRHPGPYHQMKYGADATSGAKDTLPWSAPKKKIRKGKK